MTVDMSPSRSLPAKSQDLFSAETAFVEVRKSGPTLVARAPMNTRVGIEAATSPSLVVGADQTLILWGHSESHQLRWSRRRN